MGNNVFVGLRGYEHYDKLKNTFVSSNLEKLTLDIFEDIIDVKKISPKLLSDNMRKYGILINNYINDHDFARKELINVNEIILVDLPHNLASAVDRCYNMNFPFVLAGMGDLMFSTGEHFTGIGMIAYSIGLGAHTKLKRHNEKVRIHKNAGEKYIRTPSLKLRELIDDILKRNKNHYQERLVEYNSNS